jgi:hypothetical protein
MPALAMGLPLVSVNTAYVCVCVDAAVPSRHDACPDSNHGSLTASAVPLLHVPNSNHTMWAALPGLRGQRLGGANVGPGRQGPSATRW